MARTLSLAIDSTLDELTVSDDPFRPEYAEKRLVLVAGGVREGSDYTALVDEPEQNPYVPRCEVADMGHNRAGCYGVHHRAVGLENVIQAGDTLP